MHPFRAVTVLLALLLLAAGARAEPPDLFLELARAYRPEETHRLPALRARLAAEIPDLFARPLPGCPLRSALAKALTPEEARALFLGAGQDPSALAVIVNNLAARSDLGALVLETGAYERLEAEHAPLLAEVAANALLDGDDRLVRRLLAGPGMRHAADMLSRLPHPEGLRTLADVVTGVIPLTAEARARLALFEPDVQNERPVRSLGADGVAALLRTATADPDPAVRALAARVLLRANDPASAAETARAFVEARTVFLESVDWHHLAKLAPTPVTDPRVSIEHRLDMLESWLVWTWIRAEQEPAEAEAHAAALRPVLAAAGPRFRGEAILVLADHIGVFVTTTHGRQRAVPSYLAILDDLETGRPADPLPLSALGREAAARIRAEIAEEEGYPHVRVRDRPLVGEAAWRPHDRRIDTALLGVVDGLGSLERFDAGLALVQDSAIPSDARYRLFERLAQIALDGGPDDEEGEEDDEVPFDRRPFDALIAWLPGHAPGLDGGLPEAIVQTLADTYVPEELEAILAPALVAVIDRVPEGGPRLRLAGLRQTLIGAR